MAVDRAWPPSSSTLDPAPDGRTHSEFLRPHNTFQFSREYSQGQRHFACRGGRPSKLKDASRGGCSTPPAQTIDF